MGNIECCNVATQAYSYKLWCDKGVIQYVNSQIQNCNKVTYLDRMFLRSLCTCNVKLKSSVGNRNKGHEGVVVVGPFMSLEQT